MSLWSSPILILQAGGTTVFSYLFFNKFKKGELKPVFKGDQEDGYSEEITKILCHDRIS
jgi:hypothetical protein